MVISHQHQDPAQICRAGEIGMPKRVTGAINARTFAVPHAEHAVVFTFTAQVRLLRAPDCGRCEVFIDARNKKGVMLLEVFFGFTKLVIKSAKGRSAITGYVASGVVAKLLISLPLRHGQADKGLSPGNKNTPLSEGVLVVELDGLQVHHSLRPCGGGFIVLLLSGLTRYESYTLPRALLRYFIKRARRPYIRVVNSTDF
ncbi:hypothetical protein D3C85_1070480 [compost metagenome]